ncbi:MAG: tautomerase family protein [Nanoarchaeota archaeon]|nr:tautomerase family protein [Nanoarchaeota archaeon]MBU1704223.1 tautomerase family protein [Nanoarchaeota archaeon]
MPIVEVKMWSGRTEEQKEQIIQGITKVLEDVGVPAEKTTVIITDYPKSNWGTKGVQASKL